MELERNRRSFLERRDDDGIPFPITDINTRTIYLTRNLYWIKNKK